MPSYMQNFIGSGLGGMGNIFTAEVLVDIVTTCGTSGFCTF